MEDDARVNRQVEEAIMSEMVPVAFVSRFPCRQNPYPRSRRSRASGEFEVRCDWSDASNHGSFCFLMFAAAKFGAVWLYVSANGRVLRN